MNKKKLIQTKNSDQKIAHWGTADAKIKVPSAENPELSKVLS